MKAKNRWLTYLSLSNSKKPIGAVVFDESTWWQGSPNLKKPVGEVVFDDTTKTLTDKESTTASGSGKSKSDTN